MINYVYFAAFWACQIVASILFKWGGINPKYHWHALIIGNVILLSASWFLIQLFKNVSQPIVIALCSGGTFITVQLAMALYFKTSISWIQILGIFVIVVGMIMITFGDKNQVL
jgi:multidrug transporter EmrE-like cation transporter